MPSDLLAVMQTYRTVHSPQHPSCVELAQLSRLRGPADAELVDTLRIGRIVHVGESHEVWSLEPGQGARTDDQAARRAYARLGRDFPAVLRLIEVAVQTPVRRIEVEIRDGGSDCPPATTSHQMIHLQARVLAFLRGDLEGLQPLL